MTSHEIIKANFLDLVFWDRNKDYGAYELRKSYTTRLIVAVGGGLFIIPAFLLIIGASNKKTNNTPVVNTKGGIVVRTIEIPAEKIKEPEKQKQVVQQKKNEKPATVKYTTPPAIKKDVAGKQAMVATNELENKEIATSSSEGKEADNKEVADREAVKEAGTGEVRVTGPSQPLFAAVERNPEFPGGPNALRQFLARHLNSPDELESGEKKVVQIKFKVDKDGAVTTFEIVTSGGDEFDREVLRVCKKMPRWIPALQNGIHVPVSYVLPVTFIGVEE